MLALAESLWDWECDSLAPPDADSDADSDVLWDLLAVFTLLSDSDRDPDVESEWVRECDPVCSCGCSDTLALALALALAE